MVNFSLVGARVSALYSLGSTAASVIAGNNNDGNGPYDSAPKRTERAVVAGIAGIAAAYIAPSIIPALAGASAFKTALAIGTVALNTPSVISHVYKGDTGRAKPYGSFKARALGAAQQIALGAAGGYLCYQHPEIAAAVASTALSEGLAAGKFAASSLYSAFSFGSSIIVKVAGFAMRASQQAFDGNKTEL